jgi:UDP-N-acetyl-D-galactosamine dehydrogenase
MILAGRRINDNMGGYVAGRVIKLMSQKGISVAGARVLVMGVTFKENCPDLRNSRVVDIVEELRTYGAVIEAHDPWVVGEEVEREYGFGLVSELETGRYDGVVVAVAHEQYKNMGAEHIRSLCRSGGVLFDVKAVFPAAAVDGRL